jgi:effector-binding domain-containing protein
MSLEVKVKTISPKQVLSITCHVKVGGLSQKIEESLNIMNEMVRSQHAESAGPPFGIYHGMINKKEDGPIEICLPVRGTVTGNDKVMLKQLFGGSAACVTMLGDKCMFPAILAGYDAAAAWIQKNGHQKSGPPREIWHTRQGPDAKMEIVWMFR